MRIGIIGHFGGEKQFNDGQTVKTKTLYEGFLHFGFEQVDKIDTYYLRKKPIRFIVSFLRSLFLDKKYVVLLSSNGRRILFPILALMSKCGKEIYHDSIGGRLAKEAQRNACWRKWISLFQANWVESKKIAKELNIMGIKNACYIPNFKKLENLSEKALETTPSEPFVFVTFSRIMPEKGIEDAINAIAEVNRKVGREVAKIDIYGPIEKGYEQRFADCVKKAETICTYCGVVPADSSVSVLKKYFMLIFPTYWKYEGMPGTIIDAFSAGLPIIARRWPFCDEMITDKVNGYTYDFDCPELLTQRIVYAVEHPTEVVSMKRNCLTEAYQYSEECVMRQILRAMSVAREEDLQLGANTNEIHNR